jgi:hypothetical protein
MVKDNNLSLEDLELRFETVEKGQITLQRN